MALSLLFGGVEFAISALWYGARSAYGVATYVSSARSQQSLNARLEGIERRLDLLLNERDASQKDIPEEIIDDSVIEVLFDEHDVSHTRITNGVVGDGGGDSNDGGSDDGGDDGSGDSGGGDSDDIPEIDTSEFCVPEITQLRIPIIYRNQTRNNSNIH